MTLLIPIIIFMSKDIFVKSTVPKSVVMFMPLLFICSGLAMYMVNSAVAQWTYISFYGFFYALAFFWSRNMINIQLYYITKQKYKVFNRGTVSFLIPCLFYYFFAEKLHINDEWFFGLLFIVQFIIFMEFVYKVLNEGADILNIRLFSLKPREPKTKALWLLFIVYLFLLFCSFYSIYFVCFVYWQWAHPC